MNLSQLLSLGYYPGVVIAGVWLARKLFPSSSGDLSSGFYWGLGLPLGVLVAFPALFFLALNRVFFVEAIGGVGWGICFVAVVRKLIYRREGGGRNLGVNADTIFPLCLALALFVFYGLFASESVFTGRDEGVYSNHAASIARTGWLFFDLPHEILLEPGYWSFYGTTNPNGYVHEPRNNWLYAQFPPTVSLNMAPAFGVHGYRGIILFNSLIAACSSMLFFSLLRTFLFRKWAVLGTCFFALNLAQTWNARITLSEPLTQLVLLSGIVVATTFLVKGNPSKYYIGLLIASTCAFVRVDGFVMPALVPFIGSAIVLFAKNEERKILVRAGFLASTWAGVVAGLAWVFYSKSCYLYFREFYDDLLILGVVGVSGFVIQLILCVKRIREATLSLSRNRTVWVGFVGLIIALTLYAYLIRPHVEPFGKFENPHYGDRDYRELSLVHLASYTSIPVLIFGVIGLLVTSRRIIYNSKIALLLILAPWLAYALIYLYNPNISVDHIWRIRRYTPIVIPGFIFMASYSLQWIEGCKGIQRFKMPFYYANVVAAAAFIVISMGPIAGFKQYRGAIDLIDKIGAALPDDAVVLSDISNLLIGPLHLGLGHSIINTDIGNRSNWPLLENYLKFNKEDKNPVYMITGYPLNGLDFVDGTSKVVSKIPFLAYAISPRAEKVVDQYQAFNIGRMGGPIIPDWSKYRMIRFGAHPNLGIEEEGMHGQEYANGKPFRWTTEKATFRINGDFDHPLTSVLLDTLWIKPGGTDVRITANGITLASFRLSQSGTAKRFDFEPIDLSEGILELTIEVEKWIPAEIVSGSSDQRELGIAVAGMALLFDTEPVQRSMAFGIDPVLGVEESGLYDVDFYGDHHFRWTNGDASWHFVLDDGFTPKTLEIDIDRGLTTESQLHVIWNGVVLKTEVIGQEKQTIVVPLDRIPLDRNVVLEIKSDFAIPRDLGINEDSRRLGLMISGLRLN